MYEWPLHGTVIKQHVDLCEHHTGKYYNNILFVWNVLDE